jgi:hypothetical protein
MSPLRHGCSPSSIIVKSARMICVAGPIVVLAGCASDKPNYVQGPSAQQMAAAQARKVEIEDDGQPVQSPPARAVRAEEDDPSQPWSPNYGGAGTANSKPRSQPASPAFNAQHPYIPTQVDADAQPTHVQPSLHRTSSSTSTGSLTRLSEADADYLMAQAINAHEQRRR